LAEVDQIENCQTQLHFRIKKTEKKQKRHPTNAQVAAAQKRTEIASHAAAEDTLILSNEELFQRRQPIS
jgi:hypothetical protein